MHYAVWSNLVTDNINVKTQKNAKYVSCTLAARTNMQLSYLTLFFDLFILAIYCPTNYNEEFESNSYIETTQSSKVNHVYMCSTWCLLRKFCKLGSSTPENYSHIFIIYFVFKKILCLLWCWHSIQVRL